PACASGIAGHPCRLRQRTDAYRRRRHGRRPAVRMEPARRDRHRSSQSRVAARSGIRRRGAGRRGSAGGRRCTGNRDAAVRGVMTDPSPGRPWRTIVVDDERLARQTLRLLLEREADFTIVAECGHGADAIEAIRRERPDVLFLDVQMPEVDGLEVLRRLEPGAVPAVIFVTAFDRYALQ